MQRLAILTVIAVLIAGCGASDQPATTTPDPESTDTTVPFQNGELAGLDVARAEPLATDTDMTAVTRGDVAFGLDLLRATAGDGNLMLSPYSVATALSMLHPGARGETASQIAAVLHIDVPDEMLHAVRNAIEQQLGSEPSSIPGDERELFTIRPANSAWGQGGYPFLDDYLSVLARYYGAGIRLLDFVNDPSGATDTINSWVENATEERIKDLVPDGAINPATRLVLANAIWFKANWANQFDPDMTTEDPFTLADGKQVTVPMMHGNILTGYTSNGLFQAVRLPYAGDAAMVVVVPENGSLSDLVHKLTADDLNINWSSYQVNVSLPSFEFSADLGLKEALVQLGIVDAFDPGTADLTGITAARELFVSDAFHKTFISVDESGTEAAAATALVVSLTAAPEPATFTADQPFLFWIEHTPTGEPLFIGQVTDPR